MIGERVGLLTVVSREHRDPKLGRMFKCRCDCGNEALVPHSNLLNWNTKSCGCLKRRKADLPFAGASRLREYQTWKHMLQRCHDPKTKSFGNYGAKGITVCERWRNSFADFLTDMGKAPTPKHTLDRIDTFAGYSPENCRWATMKEQQNNKTSNTLVTYNGMTMNVKQWSEYLGVSRANLHYRLKAGWPLEKVFSKGLFDVRGRPLT